MTDQESGRRTTQWVWLDRWTGNFMCDESYPPIWDEMKTNRYKPIIVWWGE